MLLEASENGVEITDEEIQQEVDTFMFAVSETKYVYEINRSFLMSHY